MKPIEYLSPYLPHGVEVIWKRPDDGKNIIQVLTISDYEFLIKRHHAKPILRPFSDLTKEIEHNGERFMPVRWLELNGYAPGGLEMDGDTFIFGNSLMFDVMEVHYNVVHKLISWGFDVFGLHEKGLCVYYNELN